MESATVGSTIVLPKKERPSTSPSWLEEET